MTTKRKVEIYSAGCAVCAETVAMVKEIACSSCEVIVHDMKTTEIAARARSLGIKSLPAVVVDDKLASCCAGRGVDEAALRAAGVGRPA